MAFEGRSDKIWYNGSFVDWDDCKIHIASHVIHYGSALFGGMRCYKTKQGSAVFRMQDHTRRLIDSCKIYRMEPEFSQEDYNEAILETIRVNRMKECYVRPIVYRGYHSLGVNPFPCPIDSAILVWEWGKYLGEEALGKRCRCLCFFLEQDGTKHFSSDGKSKCQLHEFAVDSHGSNYGWIC